MFELISFLIALIGSILASYYDLKTTEIPDYLPIIMIISGILINFLDFLFTKAAENLILSLFNGIFLSFIGFAMYFAGQWGAGDAFLLASIGFLIPKNFFLKEILPFPFDFIVNLFFLGSAYMIIYSIIYVIRNEKAKKCLREEFSKFFRPLLILLLILFPLSLIFSLFFLNQVNLKVMLLTIALTYSIILIWVFSKGVEKSFIQKIPVSKLKVGDVLLESRRWDGISEREVEKIRRRRKYVYIKSGICFAPAFLLSLLFTMFCGNSVLLLITILSSLI